MSASSSSVGVGPDEPMARVFVALGSNVRREHYFAAALSALEARYGRVERSRVYESPDRSSNGAAYFNAVVAFETADSPTATRAALKSIESALDRRRDRTGVTVDLDLLVYDDVICDDGIVTLPHPDITERDYVARPLAELDPNARHPVLRRTYAALWAERRGAAPESTDVSERIPRWQEQD